MTVSKHDEWVVEVQTLLPSSKELHSELELAEHIVLDEGSVKGVVSEKRGRRGFELETGRQDEDERCVRKI